MMVLAPHVEHIIEKLVRISDGDPALVQEALGRAAGKTDRPRTLDQIVAYILEHRKKTMAATS